MRGRYHSPMPSPSPPRAHRFGAVRVWLAEDLNEADAAAWGERGAKLLEERIRTTGAGRVLGTGRGATRAVRLGGRAAGRPDCAGTPGVVRQNRHGGMFGGLLGERFLSPSKLKREIGLIHALRVAGIATPRVLLGLAERRGPFWRQWLVTEEVAGARTVFDARDDAPALAAADALLKRLFSLGLWATDLHPGNLLWQPAEAVGNPPAPPDPAAAFDDEEGAALRAAGTCWLIDLAGARLLGRPLSPAQRRARRARFARYFQKHAGAVPRRFQL